jgi:hypothetical protein
MATITSRKVGGPGGYVGTYKANGTILMGALVKTNTTADEVLETGTGTDQAIGVALYDERYAEKNAAESFADDDPTRVEHLSAGQVWKLKAEVSITKGDLLCAAADGSVKKVTGTGEFANFRALEASDAAAYFRAAVINGRFTTTAAGE